MEAGYICVPKASCLCISLSFHTKWLEFIKRSAFPAFMQLGNSVGLVLACGLWAEWQMSLLGWNREVSLLLPSSFFFSMWCPRGHRCCCKMVKLSSAWSPEGLVGCRAPAELCARLGRHEKQAFGVLSLKIGSFVFTEEPNLS